MGIMMVTPPNFLLESLLMSLCASGALKNIVINVFRVWISSKLTIYGPGMLSDARGICGKNFDRLRRLKLNLTPATFSTNHMP